MPEGGGDIMSKTLRAALRCFAGSHRRTRGASAPQAQDQTAPMERVEEVIVTGTRAPKAVDKIPGAINVVSEAEVSRTLSLTQDATAVLARTVPGYSESSQASTVLGETLRGRVPLRLFDGIPQSTPLRDGSRNSVFTDMDIVGRIEVINGPSAAEGIGAAGGIINYISKDATEPGLNFNVFTNLSSQFEDDSDSWKAGGHAHVQVRTITTWCSTAALGDRGITYDANGRRIGSPREQLVRRTRRPRTCS
jgi:iron complex outermembrane receptor protein